MAKKPQPKPPPKAGGGARSAGGGTLAQATGGKPGKVQSAAPVKKSLGLGLGLGPRQRGNFQAAAQGGSGGQWLANHPGVQQRIGRIDPNSAQGGMRQTRIENFMGSGQSQKPPQPPTTQRQPRGAQQMGPQPQAPLQMPPAGGGGMYPGDRTMNYPGTMGGQQQIADQNGRGGWSGDNAGQQNYLSGYGGAATDQNAINANPQAFQQWQQGYAQQGGQQGGYGGAANLAQQAGYGGGGNFQQLPGGGSGSQQAGSYGQMGARGGSGGVQQGQYSGQGGGLGAQGTAYGQYGGQQQAPNYGGGMGYQGQIGGAGWQQQPTQQQRMPQSQQQGWGMGNQQTFGQGGGYGGGAPGGRYGGGYTPGPGGGGQQIFNGGNMNQAPTQNPYRQPPQGGYGGY